MIVISKFDTFLTVIFPVFCFLLVLFFIIYGIYLYFTVGFVLPFHFFCKSVSSFCNCSCRGCH